MSVLLSTWLNLRAGKTKRILHSDWLPERARWAHLSRWGCPGLVPQVKVLFLAIVNPLLVFIDQVCSVKMVWYWPRSLFIFIALDFVSVHKTAKTNYAKVTMALIDTSNEQSSWHKNVAQTEEGKQIILCQQILCTYFLSLTNFLFNWF